MLALFTGMGSLTRAEPGQYVQLRIGDQALAWARPSSGTLKLQWTFIREATQTEGAVNCGRMVSSGTPGLDETRIRAEAEAAFAYWQKAAAVEFEYTADAARANVLIGLQETPRGIAYADVVHRQLNAFEGEITRGLICLNGTARWKSGFDGDLKSYDLRFVLAHEMGHVLGLDHPSASGQLMSWRYDERIRDLQRGDVSGMAALYGPRMQRDARASELIEPSLR
jgi:hypothetical protein